jgi:phage terminase large subunit-like protein
MVIELIMAIAMTFTAQQYIDDVLAGRQIVGKYTRLAVERHVNDLKRVGQPDFPYYFDEAQAQRAITFASQLEHTKGEWADVRKHDTHIHLEPFQQFRFWCVFGWRRTDGYRRFTKVYCEEARKNGKTTEAAIVANYCFFADRPREIGPEAYFVATKRDQAKICFDEAERQAERNHVLKARMRYYRQNTTVVIPGEASRMKPIGQDSDTEDGLNPHVVIVDEYHAHKTNELISVMQSGMGARRQPLLWIITTAGTDINSPCYQEERSLVIKILERTIDIVPENVWGIIYSIDENDDWTDENVWIKSNPNLGISVSWKYLRERVAEALASPAKQNDVKTKNFNVWCQSVTRWILDESWMECAGEVNEVSLVKRSCFAGLDLSASQDITAIAYYFPPVSAGEKGKLIARFFIPEDNLIDRERRDQVPYSYWVEKKLIYTTPGNVIDYDYIEQQIKIDSEKFRVEEVAYDPWKAQEIVNHLSEVGFTMVPINQRFSGMSGFTDTFEKKVLGKEFDHGGNPVLRWMMSCTEVKSDRQGNSMPMKPRRESTGKRIDGIVASIMAVGRATLYQDSSYAYKGRELIVL